LTTVDGVSDLANGGRLETKAGPVELKDILAVREAKSNETNAAPTAPVTAPPASPTAAKQPPAIKSTESKIPSEIAPATTKKEPKVGQVGDLSKSQNPKILN
jgi:hypothetical protein